VRIERFEDIKAWQEARVLVKMVYAVVDSDRPFGRDYRFREQIQGAAVSIMSNIAEGFSRRSTKEFVQFLFIAKGSTAEQKKGDRLLLVEKGKKGTGYFLQYKEGGYK
jgi:four helix bundle protein